MSDTEEIRKNKRPRMDDSEQGAGDVSAEAAAASSSAPSRDATSQSIPGLQRKLLREEDVGITEYMDASLPAFSAIIKQRFSDFQVREIGLDGQVCRITSLAPPGGPLTERLARDDAEAENPDLIRQRREQERAEAEQKRKVAFELENKRTWPVGADARLSADGWSTEGIASIRKMWEEGRSVPKDQQTAPSKGEASQGFSKDARSHKKGQRDAPTQDPRFALSDAMNDKEKRSQAHATIRELFEGQLMSETLNATQAAKKQRAGSGIKGSDAQQGGTDDDDAMNDSSEMFLLVRWGGKGPGQRRDQRSSGSDADNHPPYVRFLLQKTNRDLPDALGILTRSLGLFAKGSSVSKDFSMAGTKDKRGVTVQAITLRRGRRTAEDIWLQANGVSLDQQGGRGGRGGGRGGRGRGRGRGGFFNEPAGRSRIRDALESRGERGVRIAHLEYVDQPLQLGMLKGNEFVVTLRNVKPAASTEQEPSDFQETLDKGVAVLRERGFINYYGLQRFGTSDISTHAVGVAIFKRDYKLAVELIMVPRSGDSEEALKARELYRQGKYGAAMDAMPRYYTAERGILLKMVQQTKRQGASAGLHDWHSLLQGVPRTMRMMYVHAYQSLIWNTMVSRRLKMSRSPIVGDLVITGGNDLDGDDAQDEGADAGVDADPEDDSADSTAKASGQVEVKALEEADLAKYTMHDIVIPLPGKAVTVTGWMKEAYEELLAADGLKPQDLYSSPHPDYIMQGAYRKVLGQPTNVRAKLLRYFDPDIDLAISDEDRLLGYPEPQSDPKGPFVALQLMFELSVSCYATMVLREVLKTDTSPEAQRALTKDSEDQAYKGTGMGGGSRRDVNAIQPKRKRVWGTAGSANEAEPAVSGASADGTPDVAPGASTSASADAESSTNTLPAGDAPAPADPGPAV